MNLYSLLCIKENFIPTNTINFLLKNKSEDFSNATVGVYNEQTITNYRKTKWLKLPQEIGTNLHHSIYLTHENHLKSIYDSVLIDVEPPQFLRYDVGDEYKLHNDSEDYVDGKLKQVVQRDISVLLYLNDDYEGGELEFVNLGLILKPKSGMLVSFPSYIDFNHRVHPVTKGVRYNIVSWIITEKRIYARPYDVSTSVQREWILSS